MKKILFAIMMLPFMAFAQDTTTVTLTKVYKLMYVRYMPDRDSNMAYIAFFEEYMLKDSVLDDMTKIIDVKVELTAEQKKALKEVVDSALVKYKE